MSSVNFLTNQNVKLLWDVITDEDIFTNASPDFLMHVNNVFNKHISPFYDHEKHNKKTLIELNKLFISKPF